MPNDNIFVAFYKFSFNLFFTEFNVNFIIDREIMRLKIKHTRSRSTQLPFTT